MTCDWRKAEMKGGEFLMAEVARGFEDLVLLMNIILIVRVSNQIERERSNTSKQSQQRSVRSIRQVA